MIRAALVFAVAALLAWAGVIAIQNLDLFAESRVLRDGARLAAMVFTAAATVAALGFLVLDFAMTGLLHTEATGLFRAIVLSALTFLASMVVLSRVGVDVGAMLTTSAILGAIVGLAMQPTLGSLVSGLAMSADQTLRVGCAIDFEGELMEVEELRWRHVVARRRDNTVMVIPNALLAATAIRIMPEDRPTQFDTEIVLPADVPPQVVTELLSGAFFDVDQLDATCPVMVAPMAIRPSEGGIVYRIRAWARFYMQIGELQGEVLRRAWYVLDRAGIGVAQSYLYPRDTWTDPAAADPSPHLPGDVVGDSVRLHRFGPGEVVRFSGAEAARNLVILAGRASASEERFLTPVEHGQTSRRFLDRMQVETLSPEAKLRRLANALAEAIGPVSEVIVADASARLGNLAQLVDEVARSIDDPEARARFEAVAREMFEDRVVGPGTTAWIRPSVSGRLVPQPRLVARGDLLVATYARRRRDASAAE
ncbi:mechanosensitive ion channel [Rhodobacterales bacterium HKCCE2091]|nr:mechanosensitive ion channel [Rhodobacterales bacterium HKCCE2091]